VATSCLHHTDAVPQLWIARIEHEVHLGVAGAQWLYGWWLATGDEVLGFRAESLSDRDEKDSKP
jgi:hypothetical protein